MKNQAMPDVSNLQGNQCARGEDHQKLGPAFLHVNAYAFGKENAAVEKCQRSGCAQRASGQYILQFVEQEDDVLAVMKQKLIIRPIGNLIEPRGTCVQKEQRESQREQQRTLQDLKERDHLEITDATTFFQNPGNMRGIAHLPLFAELFYSAMTGFARQQISNLFPSGSSKKNP